MDYILIDSDKTQLQEVYFNLNNILNFNFEKNRGVFFEKMTDNILLDIYNYMYNLSNDFIKIKENTKKDIIIFDKNDYQEINIKDYIKIEKKDKKINLVLNNYSFQFENNVMFISTNMFNTLKLLKYNKKTNESYIINDSMFNFNHDFNYDEIYNNFNILKNNQTLISLRYSDNQQLISIKKSKVDGIFYNKNNVFDKENIIENTISNELSFSSKNFISYIKRTIINNNENLEVKFKDFYIKSMIVENNKISSVILKNTTLQSLINKIHNSRLKKIVEILKNNPNINDIQEIQNDILNCIDLDILNKDTTKINFKPIDSILNEIFDISKNNKKLFNFTNELKTSLEVISKSINENTKPLNISIPELKTILDFNIYTTSHRSLNLPDNAIEDIWNNLVNIIDIPIVNNKKNNLKI